MIQYGTVDVPELPGVAVRIQVQLKEAERVVDDALAVLAAAGNRGQVAAAGTDDERPYAGTIVPPALGVQSCQPLVAVVVAGEHDILPVLHQYAPDEAVRGVVTVLAGAEPGNVPVRQRAAGAVTP